MGYCRVQNCNTDPTVCLNPTRAQKTSQNRSWGFRTIRSLWFFITMTFDQNQVYQTISFIRIFWFARKAISKKGIKRKYGKIVTGNTFYGMKMITVITSITFISTLLNMVSSNHRPNGLFPVSTIMWKGGSFQKIGEVKNVHFKKRSGWNDRVGWLNDELRKQISKSFLFSKTMFHFIEKAIR